MDCGHFNDSCAYNNVLCVSFAIHLVLDGIDLCVRYIDPSVVKILIIIIIIISIID